MSNKDHWEAIYKDKSPLEVSWYQQRPAISLALIEKYAENKSDYIIDIGGGASTLPDFLLDDGFNHVTVLDLSANALEHARQRLGKKSALIHWEVQDVTDFAPAHEYHIWHDRAVFHFLTARTEREKYRHALESSTRPGSHVIIAAFAIGGPTKCSGLDIVQYDTARLAKELGERFTFLEEQDEVHITPTGMEQRFSYHVFVKSS